jgi:hypothetical protein
MIVFAITDAGKQKREMIEQATPHFVLPSGRLFIEDMTQ